MLDPVDALHQVFQRTRNEFDSLGGLVAVGGDDDIDHRDADLRLFLARQGDKCDAADDQRREQ